MVGRPSPLTVGAEVGGALGLRPAWSVYQIPSQPVLRSVILSNKQTEGIVLREGDGETPQFWEKGVHWA